MKVSYNLKDEAHAKYYKELLALLKEAGKKYRTYKDGYLDVIEYDL